MYSISAYGNFVIEFAGQAYIYEEKLKLQLVAEKAQLQSGLTHWYVSIAFPLIFLQNVHEWDYQLVYLLEFGFSMSAFRFITTMYSTTIPATICNHQP